MSQVKITGNASGTGVLTIAAPNTNTDRTINIPDTAGNIVTTGDSATITAGMLDGGQTGSQPALACRAFVSFNGTGTVAIRTSKHISSISDNGTGSYGVNFATTFPSDYATNITVSKASGSISSGNSSFGMLREYLGNTSYVNAYSVTSAGAVVDRNYISVSVFF